MERNKPYLQNLTRKHPTLAADAVAYASGSGKTFNSTFNDLIKNVETVDLAIRTIANIISLCDMKVYKEDTKGELKAAKVKNMDFEYPNETDSSVDFLRKLAVSIFSQGAGLIVTEEGKRGKLPGKMINLYSIDIARIEAESDGKKLISQFKYASEGGTDVYYKAEDCIYINDSIDPSNLLYSLSRLKSLNDVILMQAGIVASTKDMLSGGAKDSSIISSDAPISDRNMKRIKTEFNAFMQSSTSSSLFMNTPLNVTKIGNSLSGGEMVELLNTVNTMMLEHFAIPPYLLGKFKSGANRNTEITYANRIFFSMQIKPVLKNIEKQITRFMREQQGLKNIRMVFDFDDLDILKLPYEEEVDVTLKQLKAGSITLNEARDKMEYPLRTDEAADKIFMPAYLLGSAPVSYDDYDADLERMLNLGEVIDDVLPDGNAGGDDNENLETGSTGGDDDETQTKDENKVE